MQLTCSKCGEEKPEAEFHKEQRWWCRKCCAAYYAAYYQANRAKELARSIAYYQANRARILARKRLTKAAYRKTLACQAANNRARAKRKGAKGTAPKTEAILAIKEAQRNRCAICHKPLRKGRYHIDHIMPLARGGSLDSRNLQITCAPCNLRKGAKDPIKFMQELGYLL